jgi:hypothetical protein
MADKVPANEQPVEVSNIYFNGFQLGLSNADVNGILLLNNQPSVGISMSYTTAKTLAEALKEIVATLEQVTNHGIMTTKEVAEGLTKLSPAHQGSDDDQRH